ncbi:hypothetical protein A9Q84_21165 [Halobacteriovorax marinus]|uniref:Ribosomal RNA small subunit methyltransferase E n=1 Tax=Halobacteriovorax marinus TaxID=97084 RepID=A0A1Y5F264_9BACT|nr:hypothetical protein A9Q84_21165 [Halobacteriovorax marinus]
MRAVYSEETFSSEDCGREAIIEGEHARHLIKVIRIKKLEKVLLLNGQGEKTIVEVIHFDRKIVTIKILEVTIVKDERRMSLFLGLPKKDAFESIVKMATEIGIKNIFLYRSEFSQTAIDINDRIKKMEESAIVQSNNPFKITFVSVSSFSEAFSKYSKIIHFSTFSKGEQVQSDDSQELLLVIGPEAGFSNEEEQEINSYDQVEVCHLPTNIMRAPTAFAVASGYVLRTF